MKLFTRTGSCEMEPLGEHDTVVFGEFDEQSRYTIQPCDDGSLIIRATNSLGSRLVIEPSACNSIVVRCV